MEYLIYHRQKPSRDWLIDYEIEPGFYGSYMSYIVFTEYTIIPIVG